MKTEDQLETTFQVCHLSHFYLTLQLEDYLDHSSRVIVLSSESHRFSSLPKTHLNEQLLMLPAHKYWNMTAYNNVKLCNILFARELSKVFHDIFCKKKKMSTNKIYFSL